MTKLEKETQKEIRGLIKKMKRKDPSMPNFTLFSDSQSPMVQDVKDNLECAASPKEHEIKKRILGK